MDRILRPLFDFYYEYEVKNTYQTQENALRWVKNLLLPAIEEVLSEFSNDEIIIQIDTLKLDLGNITFENFERTAPEKLKNALREALHDKIRAKKFGIKLTDVAEIREVDRLIELLVHYLGSGRGSWRVSRFSQALQHEVETKGVQLKFKKDIKVVGSLGEAVGTPTHTFDFELFWDIVSSVEPAILWSWIDIFGSTQAVTQRMVRQIQNEKIWLWLAGKEQMYFSIIENLHETLQKINQYTWCIEKVRLKGVFTETLIQFARDKESIKKMIIDEHTLILFFEKVVGKFGQSENLLSFFEVFGHNLNNLFFSYTKEEKLYQLLRNQYKKFIQKRLDEDFILNTDSIEKFVAEQIRYFTDKEGIVKAYLKDLLTHFSNQNIDVTVSNVVKLIIFNFLETNFIRKFTYQDLVKNTLPIILQKLEERKKITKEDTEKIKKEFKITDNEKLSELDKINHTLPEKKLIELLKEIEPTFADSILAFLRELSARYRWAKVSEGIFKQKIWEWTAQYFRFHQFTSFNFAQFVHTILLQVKEHYFLQEVELQAIIMQLKTPEAKILVEQKLDKSIEYWREFWKEAKSWQEVETKIFVNNQLIAQDFILRIAFEKSDKKILRIAKELSKIIKSNNFTIEFEEIIKIWLAYRWLNKGEKWNEKEDILKLLEVFIYVYKDFILRFSSNEYDSFIKSIAQIAKVKVENLPAYQEYATQIKPKKEKSFKKMSKAELLLYIQSVLPTYSNWIENIIKSLSLEENNELILWQDLASFIAKTTPHNVEKQILEFLYQTLKDDYIDVLQEKIIFQNIIKEAEKKESYLLKLFFHFVQTGEWLWTEEVSFWNEKNKIFSYQEKFQNIWQAIEREKLLGKILERLASIKSERLFFLIRYALHYIQSEKYLQSFISFIKSHWNKKTVNIADNLYLLTVIFEVKDRNTIITTFFKEMTSIFIQSYWKDFYQGQIEDILNSNYIFRNEAFLKELSQIEQEIQSTDENIIKIISRLLNKRTDNQLLENKTQVAVEDDIWAIFSENNLPDKDFRSAPLAKQSEFLLKIIQKPAKILLLLNLLLSKKNLPATIPKVWVELLQIVNLSEVLRVYFPDILLAWLASLPTTIFSKLSKENPKITEFWEEQNYHFRQEIESMQQSIKEKTYLPPDEGKTQPKKQKELEDLAKKLDQASKKWLDEPLYIQNAGLIILHPYLMRLFGFMELLENNMFKSDWEASKAVYMMEYLVRKTYQEIDEANLVLNKILCGIPLEQPLWKDIELTDKEKEVGEGLLQAVIQNWGVLGKASPDALRYGFLQREGRLTPELLDWRLRVEQKGMDVLVERLPWGIGTIKLPLMKGFLYSEWT